MSEAALATKKTAVILTAQGFEDEEVIYPLLRLQEAGIETTLATPGAELVTGRVSYPLARLTKYFSSLVDARNLNADQYDVVIVPGGFEAPDRLRIEPAVLDFLRAASEKGKIIASICHGPRVLISAGLIKGRTTTAHSSVKDDMVNAGAVWSDNPVVTDGRLITAQHPRDIGRFMHAVLTVVQP